MDSMENAGLVALSLMLLILLLGSGYKHLLVHITLVHITAIYTWRSVPFQTHQQLLELHVHGVG